MTLESREQGHAAYYTALIGQQIINSLSDKLKEEYPSHTCRELIELFGIQEKWSIPDLTTARVAVQRALTGNNNPMIGPVYQGVFTREEAKRIADIHRKNGVEKGRRNPKISKEEKMLICHKAGIAHARNNHLHIWSEEEMIFAMYLAQDPNYQLNHKHGLTSNGKPKYELNCRKIASEINLYFYNNQEKVNATSLSGMIYAVKSGHKKLFYENQDCGF